jgi:glycosyltransferase involved in cell wall biosynthesis
LGIPVVATDCSGGTREIFDGVEQRHLCAVGDYHSMAVKILNFLHEPPLSTNMLSLVYPMFAVETIAQSYTESLVV